MLQDWLFNGKSEAIRAPWSGRPAADMQWAELQSEQPSRSGHRFERERTRRPNWLARLAHQGTCPDIRPVHRSRPGNRRRIRRRATAHQCSNSRSRTARKYSIGRRSVASWDSFPGILAREAATERPAHQCASRRVTATETGGGRLVPDETQKGLVAGRKETAAEG